MAFPTSKDASPDLLTLEKQLLDSVGVSATQGELLSRGLRVHTLSAGEGDPLILIHGRGAYAATFAPVMSGLAARHRVIALDLPGWGLTEKPPFWGSTGTDALNFWLNAVVGVMDELSIPQAAVLGHSLGGFVALGYALRHPERVSRLLLVDSAGIGSRNPPLPIRVFYLVGPERLAALAGENIVRWVYSQVAKTSASEPAAALEYAVLSQPEILASGASAFDAVNRPGGWRMSYMARLPELTMPVLLLWGERDVVTRHANAVEALSRLPDASLVTFEGVGHVPHQENPTQFAEVVLTWLDGEAVPEKVKMKR